MRKEDMFEVIMKGFEKYLDSTESLSCQIADDEVDKIVVDRWTSLMMLEGDNNE